MRYRQVHLDFHTSEAIAGIGSRFSKSQFQNMRVPGTSIPSRCFQMPSRLGIPSERSQ